MFAYLASSPLRVIDYARTFFQHDRTFLKEDFNFGPVNKEVQATNLPITGKLPKDLNGEFVRNGPNNKYPFVGVYHWFDGDGMLHGLLMKDGKASYVNRWVQTKKLQLEDTMGCSLPRPSVGDLLDGGVSGVLGIVKVLAFKLLNKALGFASSIVKLEGTANTALVFHHGQLYALVENALPYAVQIMADGALQTIGAHSYDGRLTHPFTAHPKVDPVSGEMRFFGYRMDAPPYVQYSVVSADGELTHTFDPELKAPSMMHDFAISEHYSILMDFPLRFDAKRVARGLPLLYFNNQEKTKFAVFDRHCGKASEVKWFSASTCYVFHTANAWEHGDKLSLLGIRYPEMHLNGLSQTGGQALVSALPSVLYQWTFDLSDGSTGETTICEIAGEFPVINPKYLGRAVQYVYYATAAVDKPTILFDGVVKVDVSTGTVVDRIVFGRNLFGGECVFVPKPDGTKEDDGYLLTFVHDISKFWVMDASTMATEPLAVVQLPVRVPFGFHGIFVSADEIAQ